jgi:hypothetical protein
MSYEGHHEDRAKIMDALGGKRGLIDSGVPSIVFLIAFNISSNLNRSIIAAIVTSMLFTILRLVRRETVQHAISGLIGIVICALFARHSGKAADFYLFGLYKNAAYGAVYAISNIVKWPLIGVMLGPILGENFEWRKNPARLAAYRQAGWIWMGLFFLRVAIQYPLWKTNHLNWLGTANIFLGYPLFIFAAWITWLIVKRVPTVKATN